MRTNLVKGVIGKIRSDLYAGLVQIPSASNEINGRATKRASRSSDACSDDGRGRLAGLILSHPLRSLPSFLPSLPSVPSPPPSSSSPPPPRPVRCPRGPSPPRPPTPHSVLLVSTPESRLTRRPRRTRTGTRTTTGSQSPHFTPSPCLLLRTPVWTQTTPHSQDGHRRRCHAYTPTLLRYPRIGK